MEYKREAFRNVSEMVRWLNEQPTERGWTLVSFSCSEDCIAVLRRQK